MKPQIFCKQMWTFFFWTATVLYLCSCCCCLVAKSCHVWLLCNSMDCSTPGSSVRGILLAIIPEWIAISSCRGSSQLGDRTPVSCIACGFFTPWAPRKALSIGISPQSFKILPWGNLYLMQVCIYSQKRRDSLRSGSMWMSSVISGYVLIQTHKILLHD